MSGAGTTRQWPGYLALMAAYHALANTEHGTWRAINMAFSVVWAIPTAYYLIRSWRDV